MLTSCQEANVSRANSPTDTGRRRVGACSVPGAMDTRSDVERVAEHVSAPQAAVYECADGKSNYNSVLNNDETIVPFFLSRQGKSRGKLIISLLLWFY